MLERLHTTRIVLAVATLAVLVSGAFIGRGFLGHVFVDCNGTLVRSDAAELGDRASTGLTQAGNAVLEILYDEVQKTRRGPLSYRNVRVGWRRSAPPAACSEIPIPWEAPGQSPAILSFERDDVTGLFVVRTLDELVVFRKVEGRGHRFEAARMFDASNLSVLVFLVSLLALTVGGVRAMRATPYARRMHAWRPATLRPDGVVESDTGATLGRLERAVLRPGSVIVDPTAFEGRDVYREVPMLDRRTVAIGTHERWLTGTMRRLRDARALAIIATLTTIGALAARLLGA